MSKPKKYYPIFAKYNNRAVQSQAPQAAQQQVAVAAAAAPPPTTRKRSRSRSWDLAESGPYPKSLKTDIPSSPHSSKPRAAAVSTPKVGNCDAEGTGADDSHMDTSISPIPIHRERGVAPQPSVVRAPQPSHRRSNSGGNAHKGRSGRVRPTLLLTESNKKVHHPHVTHRGGASVSASGNKENKENLLPPWKTTLDSTLPDQNSFKSSGHRFIDSLRSELGLTSPQKYSLKRASRASHGGSPGLSISPLSRHNAKPSPRGAPLPLQDLNSTLVEDEGSETPLISSRELSQNTRLTANKDDTMRPPRELSLPHSARALFPPTPQKPLTTSSSGYIDMQNSSDSPSEAGSRPARLFGGKKLPSMPEATRPTGGNVPAANKPVGFPPAPRKSRGQQNRFRGVNDASTSRGSLGGMALRSRASVDSSSSSSFGFAAPSRSPRRKPIARALPDTPVMMSPAYGDDSQDAPGTKARPRVGILSRAASSSFDIGAFGKAFSGGPADFGATDSQGSVRPTALCFDSQSDINSRDSFVNRAAFCDVPGTPKVDYSQSDDMTCSPSPLDSQGGHSRDSFESPETCSQDNLSQRSGRFTASTLRKKRASALDRSHTPSRLFSKPREALSNECPPTPWNGILKPNLNSKPPPSPYARGSEDIDMAIPMSRTHSIGSLRISIPPPSAGGLDDDDEMSFLTPVNQNAPMLQRTVSEQVILEENRRHRCRRSAGEDTERALSDIASKGNHFLPMLLLKSPSEDGSSSVSSVDGRGWRPLNGREPPKIPRKSNRRISAGRRGHNGTMLEDAAVSVAKFSEAFKPIHNLGKGSFGQIKLSRSRVDGCYYAIKMIRRAGLAPSQFNEVFALSAIQQLPEQCPYIVRYSSAFIEDGMLNIVFEYCAGGGLRDDYLSQFETDEEREKVLKTVADQMLQALDFIHKFGIAHLDVKTANFLRYDKDRHDAFKLCDFGLAMNIEEAKKTGVAPDGDGRYVAPELFTNRAFDLRKCDVYSLGCALLELASREKLGSRGDDAYLPNVFARSAAPREEFRSRLSGFSPKFLSWIQTLLVEDPTKRASVASAIVSLHMLGAPSQHSPIPSRQASGNSSSLTVPPSRSSTMPISSSCCTTPSMPRRSASTLPVLDDSPSAVASQLSSLTIHSQNSRAYIPEQQVPEVNDGGDAKNREIWHLVTESDAKDCEILLLREQMMRLQKELAWHRQAREKDDEGDGHV